MKKTPLLLSPIIISLLPLSGCGGKTSTITLYDADSRFVIQSFDSQGSITLPTYRNSKTGEVPYSELGEFFYAHGALGYVKTTVKKINGKYQVIKDDGKILATVDSNNDIFTVENYEYWSGMMKPNNGVGPDLASHDDSDDGAVHESNKSKYIGERKPEVYDLKKYNIDFIEKDDKCYLPSQFLSNLYYRWMGNDVLYNGMDFYLGAVVRSAAISNINQSYYATNKRFMINEDTEAKSYEPVGQEEYRFAYPASDDSGKVSYRIISLTKDGKGKLLLANQPSEAGIDVTINGVDFTYSWEKKNDYLFIETFATRTNPDTGEKETATQGIFKVPLKDTFFGLKKRSKAFAKFTYDLLRFQYDTFYGIKDVVGFKDFESLVNKKGLKNKLLSENITDYDEALAEITEKHFNDPHSAYVMPSIFSGQGTKYAKELTKKNISQRYTTLMNKKEEYVNLRAKTIGITAEMDPFLAQGYFSSGNTAVIRFDSFAGQGSIVTNSYEPGEAESANPTDCFKNGDVPLGFDASFVKISKNPNIKNVVIDISCNNGGMVMTIPYIVAYFSKDPTLYFKDLDMGVVKEMHYSVDLNHDKVWGGEGDTFEGKYNFYILTSATSFSCANFLPTIAKYSGVKVIGEKSGGGAASVGSFSDGCGSFYNWSSPQICVYPKGNEFVHNDGGVAVDYELPSTSWYDLDKLDQFISGLK